MTTERLHLVDGTFELFRAHYGKRPGALEVKASVGVVSSMLALLQDAKEAVTHLAIAFDNPIRCFRNDLCAARGDDFYKQDEGVDPILRGQFDLVEEGIRALGVVVWSMDRWEADDGLATGAARFKGSFAQVRILSPDKDLGQCVEGTHVVQIDRMRDKTYDEAGVRAARGVAPRSIPDFLALVGDTADGIPGIPGIGERTAATLLSQFGHLESIPVDGAAWPKSIRGAETHAKTLAARADDARFYRTLATLIEDVPLRESRDDLEFKGVPRAAFTAFCEKVGSKTLLERPRKWRP